MARQNVHRTRKKKKEDETITKLGTPKTTTTTTTTTPLPLMKNKKWLAQPVLQLCTRKKKSCSNNIHDKSLNTWRGQACANPKVHKSSIPLKTVIKEQSKVQHKSIWRRFSPKSTYVKNICREHHPFGWIPVEFFSQRWRAKLFLRFRESGAGNHYMLHES